MSLQDKAHANGATYWQSYKVKCGDIAEAVQKLKKEIIDNWDWFMEIEKSGHNPSPVLNKIDEIFGEKFA